MREVLRAERFMASMQQEPVSKEGVEPVSEPGQLVSLSAASVPQCHIRGLGEEKPKDNDYITLISEA